MLTVSPKEYQAVTNNILVSVVPFFIEEKSETNKNVYVFSYHVTLENLGAESIQLINRHWRITAGGKPFADVKGEGVVGERPMLEPGEPYQYSSWTVITEPYGSMSGCYTCRTTSGDFFDIAIPEFDLLYVDTNQLH